MSLKYLSRLLFATLIVAGIGQLARPVNVDAGFGNFKIFDQTGCNCCPDCGCCSLEAELVDVEKKCYETECKVICIPRVVFPWQKKKSCGACDSCDGRGCNACVHNGAKTRQIQVLKSKKYKCPKCQYTWTPDNKTCCTGCDAGCDSCCDAECDAAGLAPYAVGPMTYREMPVPTTEPVEIQTQELPAK